MKTHLPLLILTLLTILLFALGCGQEPMVPPTPIPTLIPATLPIDTPTPVPEVGAEPTSPASQPPSQDELVQTGQQLFEQNCNVCHNLTTETKVGPGLEGLFNIDQLPNGDPFSEDNLRHWIVTGGGGMPAFPLTEGQLDAVVAFLKQATQP
jgi:mono/diheme cytochrome c family protein